MPLLLLALAVGGYLYMNQGKDFATSYKVKFIDGLFDAKKTQNSSFSKLFFSIRLTVENPSDFKGTLQGAKLTLSYKGKSLGDITLQKPVTIVPKGNTSVELPVAVPTLSLISNLQQLIQAYQNQQNITFNVKGTLEFALGTLKVNNDYKVPLK